MADPMRIRAQASGDKTTAGFFSRMGPSRVQEPLSSICRQGRESRRQNQRNVERQQGRKPYRRGNGLLGRLSPVRRARSIPLLAPFFKGGAHDRPQNAAGPPALFVGDNA